jgi:hypothetical protein
MSGTIDKIRSRGSWTVRIRPGEYKEGRVTKLGDLEEAVRTCAVELRGWDFPHFDYKVAPTRTPDFVEQQLDWEQYVEIWRAYKSGQFISITAIYGDWRDQSKSWPPTPEWHHGDVLSVEDTIFRFAEIFEFAARWAKAVSVGEEMVVGCSIQGLQNRVLALSPRRHGFSNGPRCSTPTWSWSKRFPTAVLFSAPRDHAIEPAIHLFELFGWDVAREVIRDIQHELRA